MDRRAKSASQLGFERIIGPGVLLPGEGLSKGTLSDQAARAAQHASQSFRWTRASSLKDTLRLLWNQENRT
jgi:hypothetical protein